MPEDGCNDPQVTVSALADYIAGVKDRALTPQEQAEPREKVNAREYVAFLKREFGEGMGQDLPHFTIGNVSRAFSAGWIAALAITPQWQPSDEELIDLWQTTKALDFRAHYLAFARAALTRKADSKGEGT
jgi:hypothetical protein